MATIYDVARECGVSLTTVSLVLNKRPHSISESTQQRVFETARRLNYHPSALARGLMKRRLYVLGVVFNTVEPAIVTNSYAAGVLGGVFWAASQAGYQVLLFTTPWVSAEVSAAPFRDGRTDGLLIVGPSSQSDVVAGISGLSLPCVVVSADSGVSGVPYVDIDNYQAGQLAAEHLLSLGHRKIGHVLGLDDQISVIQRRNGFLETLAAAGIETPSRYLAGGGWDYGPVRERTIQLMTAPDPPTALFCTNDDIAVAVCQAINGLGLKIPEDVSVVGCDDYPFAALLTPPLTTVHHPLMQVGHVATDLLIQLVQSETHHDFSDNARQLLPVELVVRGSTGHVTNADAR